MKNERDGFNRSLLPSEKLSELDFIELEVNKPIPYPAKVTPEWGSYGSYGEEEEGVHLREYLRQIRRHKFLILSLVTIVTTLVAFQAYRIKPWYTASAVLEIGKENATVLKSGDVTINDESDPDYMVNINTKKLALENPALYQKVADNLKLDEDPRVLETFKQKPLFSFLDSSNKEEKATTPIVKPNKPAKDENQQITPFADYIQKNVAVEQIKSARALKISYTDGNPELAAKITNDIAKVFMDTNFGNQTEKYTNSVDWLDAATRELKAKVQIAEEALANYTRDNQIYSTDGNEGKTATLTTSKLTQLHDQYIRTQTERMLKKSLYEQVQAGRFAELPEAFSDPKITQLQQQLNAFQTQAAELKVKFGPTNPKMIEVQNQITVLNTQIENSTKALEAKLKADYERSVQDENSLQTALNTAKAAAVNENQASIKYNILKQDVDTARSLYTDFLQKTNQAKARVAEQNNNIKFIQQAQTPSLPVGPKRLTIILAGFFLSLVAGIGLALFLEYLDNTIKSLDDVERYTQLPTLGVIPALGAMGSATKFLKGRSSQKKVASSENDSQLGLEHKKNTAQSDLALSLDNHSLAGEAYRALRTSLLLSTAGTPPKTILVTSGQSSEGKSTTAINTAFSLSQLGAKVLIIDCDLRRPSVHKKLDISSAKGLSNYLASNIEINAVIQELGIPNLSVIPSGAIPPNPAELLSSQKMKDMLKLLRNSYDHIILDSPPVVNVTDPIILSTIVDGTIFVIQGGKTTREVAQRARQELLNVKSKVFGVVLNNVDIHRDGYDYYSYYRYSSYYKSNDNHISIAEQ